MVNSRMNGLAESRPHEECDVLVVGGGISGLATALELRRRGRSVVVLSRDLAESATRAAGGMLAPQAERLESGPLLDLCLAARERWPEWLESLGPRAPNLNSVGGFVSPASSVDDPIATFQPPEEGGPFEWLTSEEMASIEPGLTGGKIAGGYWYPLESWVDPVAAHKAVFDACKDSGVDIRVGAEVTGFDLKADSTCGKVRLSGGKSIRAQEVCVAAGAWLRNILPIPVEAQKGQMLSLRPPPGVEAKDALLARVVYGSRCYLIPRGDKLVVGATVEDSATSHCDVRGIKSLLTAAVDLCPSLDDWILDEAWAGLRPITPDRLPVLGPTTFSNLWVVGGYWRNGILLAPKAAQLIADAVDGNLSPEDSRLLRHFAPNRFMGGVTTQAFESTRRDDPTPRVDSTPKPKISSSPKKKLTRAEVMDVLRDPEVDILDLIDRESLDKADRIFVDQYEADRDASPIGQCIAVDPRTGDRVPFRFKFPPPQLGVPTHGTAERLVTLASSADLRPPEKGQGRLFFDQEDVDQKQKAVEADRLYDTISRRREQNKEPDSTADAPVKGGYEAITGQMDTVMSDARLKNRELLLNRL